MFLRLLSFIFICSSLSALPFRAQADDMTYSYYNYKTSAIKATWIKQKRPLLLWIHGCNQSDTNFVEITDIVAKTKSINPIIMAPHQKSKWNVLKCWNFLSSKMQSRSGEFMQVVSEIQKLVTAGVVDPERIFVGGFSSGGMFANHLALCFPDMFKGALVHSGGPFKIAGGISVNSARDNAKEALICAQDAKTIRLKTLLYIHGEKDKVVLARLGRNAFEQSVEYLDYLDDGRLNQSSKAVFRNGYDGLSVYYPNEKSTHFIEIANMGHRWSGSKAGSRFSSPDTLSAIDVFLEATLNLK